MGLLPITYAALALFGLIVFLAIYKRRAIKSALAKGWSWVESSNMNAPQVAGNRLSFALTGQAQYLINFDAKRPYTRLSVATEGEAVSVRGGEPIVSLFFIAKGEDWQGKEGLRWWSKATCGPNGSLAISLDPADWISVWGHTGDTLPKEFADALKNIEGAGVTFGGTQGGRGKGWTGSGPVILELS